jgi:hypothetical protein
MAGALASVDERVAAGVRLSEAVRQVAETTSVSRRILYEAALEAQAARDS